MKVRLKKSVKEKQMSIENVIFNNDKWEDMSEEEFKTFKNFHDVLEIKSEAKKKEEV